MAIFKNKKGDGLRKKSFGIIYRLALLIILMLGLDLYPAFSVDFITKEQFELEENPYKHFPLKILFKKLNQSKAPEKMEIRNTIILKQAFERSMQEKVKAGVVKYEKSYGLIKSLDNDKLSIWIPKSNHYQNFYVGLGKIPLVNPHSYDITESNINQYAAVVFSLDKRIYKIQVNFFPAQPTGLTVTRIKNENIVGWNPPASVAKPAGYRVYINEKPFTTVENTEAKVPRIKGRVDTYYVKAFYKHGESFIDSTASELIIDEITARENQQEMLAAATYAAMIAALNPEQWQKARGLLNDNQALFSEHLDPGRKAAADRLTAFFSDIETGDRISSQKPETLESLDQALTAFKQADQKARSMPADIDVAFLPRLKISAATARRAKLEKQSRQKQATATYALVLAALNPSEWQKAKRLLEINQSLFRSHLDPGRKASAESLTAFFSDIEAGDRISSQKPDTLESLDQALKIYQNAGQKAQTMPPGIDVIFLPRLKINTVKSRQAVLENRRKEILAATAAVASQIQPAKSAAQKIAKAAPFDQTLDHRTLVKQAQENFKDRNYDGAFLRYSAVYGKQIQKINQGGNKLISGVLGLPSKLRAQIIFLIERDRLKQQYNNNDAMVRNGLEALALRIENKEGLWSIIPEAKRNQLIDLIANY